MADSISQNRQGSQAGFVSIPAASELFPNRRRWQGMDKVHGLRPRHAEHGKIPFEMKNIAFTFLLGILVGIALWVALGHGVRLLIGV